MSIAEKLTRAKADLDAVYQAGGGGALAYATNIPRMFQSAEFPSGHEMVLDIPNCPTNIQEMFRTSYGLKKLTMNIPTDRAYNAQYFAYGSTKNKSTLEELVLPDGIKVSNFLNFVNNCYALKKIICGCGPDGVGIDLSESTSNESAFYCCNELVEVRFMPNTIKMSISFAQSSKLSDASIASIIAGLNPYDASEQTLTVHPDVAARITKTDVTDRGWGLVVAS